MSTGFIENMLRKYQSIKNLTASPSLNNELGGLFSIALGAKPLEKYPGCFADHNEKARYKVTKKYGVLSPERAAEIYIALANAILK